MDPQQKNDKTVREGKNNGDRKGESNNSPEIPDWSSLQVSSASLRGNYMSLEDKMIKFGFFRFTVVLRPQKPSGLLGTKDGHLDFHTAPDLW